MTVYVDIPGFPGYKTSRCGEVVNRHGVVLMAKSRQLFLRVDGKQVGASRASLVLRAFVGPPKEGECALHSDDDQTHNDLSNLRWGTRQENYVDARRNGKLGPGSVQARGVAKAWAEGAYSGRTETRKAKHGGTYGMQGHDKKVCAAWKTGKYQSVDWAEVAKRGWAKRRAKRCVQST